MLNRSEALFRAFAVVLFTVFVWSALGYAVTADRVTGVIDSSRAIALPKSLHPKAQRKYDRGPVDPSFKLASITLMTMPSAGQQKALDQLLREQQDATSPNYHKWLTPSKYADQFGLSQNDINRITAWLKAQGFVVQNVGGGRNTVKFSGTAAQVQSAFQTEIHRYSVDGEEHFANATPLMLPAAFKGVVSGVLGVHNFRMHPASSPQRYAGLRPRANYYDVNFLFPNFLAPADVATIYDFPTSPALDGTGEKIAMLGRSDIFLADLNDFRVAFGLTPISASNCTLNGIGIIKTCNDPLFSYVLLLPTGQTDPGVPDSIAAGDVTEADLDVEWSGGVAYNAQVVYINAPSPAGNDVLDALSYALNPPTGTPIPAHVVSLSFSACEAASTSLETELQQGASEGITIVNSAGDAGAAACDPVPPNSATVPPFTPAVNGLSVGYPASSPWVTGVGGTSISLSSDSYPYPSGFWTTSNGSNGGTATGYIPELAWNDNETWANYCSFPATGDTFCSTGNGTTGWIAINSTQTAQQDLWIASGGGGASNCFVTSGQVCTGGLPQPTWQQGLTVPSAPSGVRWVPDVSLLASADFPGYILCTPQNPDASTPVYTSTCVNGVSGSTGALEMFNSVIGGTSASAPVFAGMVALLNQSLAGSSSPGLGLINPMLYQLALSPFNHPFNQVTNGDNMVYCSPGLPLTSPPQPASIVCPAAGIFGYSASNSDPTTGYNLVTGLGSVDLKNLATAWATAPGFQLSATALTPANISAGNTASSTVTLTVLSALFNGTVVTFACSGLPSGASCSFNPDTATASGTTNLTVSTLANTLVGPNSITVTGTTSNGVFANAFLSLNIAAPSFALALSSSSASVVAGHSTGPIAVTVAPEGAFTSQVSFSCPGALPGMTCAFNPATVTPSGSSVSTSLTISTLPNAANGPTNVTVSATGGTVTQTSTVALTVNQSDEAFTLSPAAGSYIVTQGNPVTATIKMAAMNGFVTPVAYTCSLPPTAAGAKCIGPAGTTSATSVSFQIITLGSSSALNRSGDRGSRIFYAALLPGLLGIMFTVGSRRRSLRSMRMLGLIMVLGVSTMWLGSCGSSNNSSTATGGTPKGTYSVTVNATTGGASPITSTTTFQLIVQ